MHIGIIAGNYPHPANPAANAFIQQFAWALARAGHDCTVINPFSVLKRVKHSLPEKFSTESAGDGRSIKVIRPRFISFSARKVGWMHTAGWTQTTMNRAVIGSVRKMGILPDVFYGHFLYLAGFSAVEAGNFFGKPSVVGVGEGAFWTVRPFGFERAKRDFRNASGFLAVGTHVKKGLMESIGIEEQKIIVEPNGVDRSRFKPMDKAAVRAELGLNPERFLVLFIGTFDDLKGGTELVEAAGDQPDIDLAMIGKGPRLFASRNLVYNGCVPHHTIPLWLNAADLFVLPTREEGSCNAILEAMACGIPIVTSNGAYMDDIVDHAVSVRVDPHDVRAIRSAIRYLKTDPHRRAEMSAACIEKAKQFDINDRAVRVSEWMKSLAGMRLT